MSASSKKKLRKEQYEAALTEKQQKEKKEAKKLKVYTVTFITAMVLVVAILIGVAVRVPITGALDRASHAVTIGNHKLSATDLSYYYVDAINQHYSNLYNSYGNYAQYFLGFKTDVSLNQQIYDKETGTTWAQHFIDAGIENAQKLYALYDLAASKGHKLTEDEQKSRDTMLSNLSLTAKAYGYSSVDSYLRTLYGTGANVETYSNYYDVYALATSYYTAYADTLEYTDEEYRAFEKGKFNDYSSFTYAVYKVTVSDYLTGGTKSEDGKTTTYSDEEKAAALAAAKKDAEDLVAGKFKDLDAFNKAIKALKINEKKPTAGATEYDGVLYLNITDSDTQRWVGNVNRQPGDMTSLTVSKTVTNKDEDGKESTTLETTAFNVVYFQERDDNRTNLVDVMHILIKFQGGTTNSTTGETTYSDAEKAAAKEKAEKLYAEWKAGEATKESFAELAKQKSEDTGSTSNGGLYEDIYPGRMVTTFNDWCFDEDRKPGDTDLVASEYGYHIMYFVETGDITYRDYMIKNELMSEELEEWHEDLTEKVNVEKADLSRLNWDYIFS